MALRHDANDANLSRIADDLIGIRELLDKMDHAQDALLENGQSLQGQLEALTGQITHMIQSPDPGAARTGRTIARRPSRPHPDPAIRHGRPAAPDQRRPDAARACRSRRSPRQHSRQRRRARLIPMLNFRKISAASDGAAIRAYMTQDQPEPESLKVHGVALDGRDLETGERLTAYYTGRGERANWRPDMDPRVAAALGIASARAAPRDGQLDALFEARRADTGEDWSQHVREKLADSTSSSPRTNPYRWRPSSPPHRGRERQMIRNAIHAASDDALRYAAHDLGFARKGHAGEKGAEAGEIGWVTFAHDAARPTVAVQNGPDGATYLLDAPIAGDPHYHLHNFIPNLVVTDDGRVGSIDSKALTAPQGP